MTNKREICVPLEKIGRWEYTPSWFFYVFNRKSFAVAGIKIMSKSSVGKILFIVKSLKTPSSRIRALDLLPGLHLAGFECEIEYLPNSFFARRRLFQKCVDFDVVVFQKRLLSFFEFSFLRRNAKKLVFDFDDAVYMRNAAPSIDSCDYISSTRSRRFKRVVKKVDLVIAANPVLAEMVNSVASKVSVEIVPSSVPIRDYEAKDDYTFSDPPVIGWVGTSVTMRYLNVLAPALCELRKKHPFVLRVISNAEFVCDGIDVENLTWSLESESREIRKFDIGVMPLSDDPFSKGKSSYKLLQYMACGVPAVASAVGMNIEVADGERCALLADSPAAFAEKIGELLVNSKLRQYLGRAARKKVKEEFERNVVATRLASILKKIC